MTAIASADISVFDDFRLDRRCGVLLRRNDQGVFVPVALGRRALDLLGVLVEHPGDVVSRDKIMTAVWPGTVVEDGNLSVQISTLRRVLDHGRSEDSLIQTVPGRGYRFVGEVTQPEPNSPPAAAALASPATASLEVADIGQPVSPGPRRRSARAVVVLVIALCLAGLGPVMLFTSDYRWLGKTAPPPRLSIVVLPFMNLSEDRAQEYFVNGVTEDLTTDLSRMPGSFVISRNTAFTYKDKAVDAKQVGRELGVRYVVEGSLQRTGKQVRVNTQLIDTETSAHLWAERFEHDIGDLFDLQNEIAVRIGSALNVRLFDIEAARPRERSEALDYIFLGRAAMNKGPARDSLAEAIGFFERALSLDPTSVSAQGHLANALTTRVLERLTDTPAADLERAEQVVGQALAASPKDPFAHFAKGKVLRSQGRCEEASIEFETVLAVNRNSMGALMQIGRCRISLGLLDESIPATEQAIRLSPHDPFVGVWYGQIGQAHLLQSRPDEAIPWLEKSRSILPGRAVARIWIAAAYALKDDTKRAAVELAEARRLAGDDRYSSIARLKADGSWTQNVRARVESTYYAGLRKAGMPED